MLEVEEVEVLPVGIKHISMTSISSILLWCTCGLGEDMRDDGRKRGSALLQSTTIKSSKP